MGVLSKESHKRLERYDSNIGRYASYLDQRIKGVSATKGKLAVTGNGGTEEIDCVSIDNVVGFPETYRMDAIPTQSNGRYNLDLIIYAPGKEKDEFIPNGKGIRRARVEFKDEVRSKIYKVLMEEGVMLDLTIRPYEPKSRRFPDLDEMTERDRQIRQRKKDNMGNLWLYYTTNAKGSPGFVVHIPQDPYDAVPLLKKWIGNIQYLGSRLSNK